MKTHAELRFSLLPLIAVATLWLTASAFAGQYVAIHNFLGKPGAYPASGLIVGPDGRFYGTTASQGVAWPKLCGVVFKMTKTSTRWQYSVIHTFQGPAGDGELPFGQLMFDAAGNIYGTTFSSATDVCFKTHIDCGTVFMLSPNSSGKWTEQILYKFTAGLDGAFPTGQLAMDALGNVYGTTFGGGPGCAIDPIFGCGVVFELSPGNGTWTQSVLYSFTGGSDGSRPEDIVFDKSGNIIGLTELGDMNGGNCCGTFFELSPGSKGWTYSLIHAFMPDANGSYPRSGFTQDANGNIFGATSNGGIQTGVCGINFEFGCGTIFELSPNGSSWNFTVLHRFSGSDGEYPLGVTLDATGNLFGATRGGGNYTDCPGFGCGTVYKLSQSSGKWKESVLYKFTGNPAFPAQSVAVDGSGNVFGGTLQEGTASLGTLFEVRP